MNIMYDIDPHDTVFAPFLFREYDSTGNLVIKEYYQEFACANCNKINELEALTKGFPPSITIKSRRSYIFSLEYIHLVDAKVKALLIDLFKTSIIYFDINSTGYSAAMARTRCIPKDGDSAFRFLNKCTQCGRYGEILNGKTIPSFHENSNPFMAIYYESMLGMNERWLVTEDYAKILQTQKPPLTGLVAAPKEISFLAKPESL